jgi:hypothetical protein
MDERGSRQVTPPVNWWLPRCNRSVTAECRAPALRKSEGFGPRRAGALRSACRRSLRDREQNPCSCLIITQVVPLALLGQGRHTEPAKLSHQNAAGLVGCSPTSQRRPHKLKIRPQQREEFNIL